MKKTLRTFNLTPKQKNRIFRQIDIIEAQEKKKKTKRKARKSRRSYGMPTRYYARPKSHSSEPREKKQSFIGSVIENYKQSRRAKQADEKQKQIQEYEKQGFFTKKGGGRAYRHPDTPAHELRVPEERENTKGRTVRKFFGDNGEVEREEVIE